jgi:hypothetical protein
MSKNTVTQKDVDAEMVNTKVTTLNLHDNPVTFVETKMRNGFTVRETTTCVDPANYDEAIGADICKKRIEDQIWMLLGFLLQDKLFEAGEL